MTGIRPLDFSNHNETILDRRIFGQRLWTRSGGYDVAALLASWQRSHSHTRAKEPSSAPKIGFGPRNRTTRAKQLLPVFQKGLAGLGALPFMPLYSCLEKAPPWAPFDYGSLILSTDATGETQSPKLKSICSNSSAVAERSAV